MSRFSTQLMDHVQSPRNGGVMPRPDRVGYGSLHNQAPRIEIYLQVEHDRVSAASFTAFGCGVTIAAASCLTELVQQRTREECQQISVDTICDALGGVPEDRLHAVAVVVQALNDAWQEPPLKNFSPRQEPSIPK